MAIAPSWLQSGHVEGAQVADPPHGGAGGGRGGGRGGAGGPVPVTVVPAKREDVPIYVTGIGTVRALNTVAVTPQVSGAITQVAFTEGQVVKRGDLLVQVDPRPYENTLLQAQGQLARDEAFLANAELDLKRYQTLAAQNSIALQQVDTQTSLVKQYEGIVKTDQGTVQTAALNVSMTRIVSPINGRTGLRQIDIGNVVQANTANAILVVTQMNPISVIFTLPESAFEQVRTAQLHGKVPVTALDTDHETVIDQGTLLTLSNEIDTTTGTIPLKATFPNASLRLWPGQFINIRALLGYQHGVVTVPSQAIQIGPDGSYVYVISQNDTAKQRDVRTGITANGVIVVAEGLQPGDRVVTQGQFKLIDGSKVQVAPVVMARAGTR
ncbi:MAG TPA: efflux RND transporter periplasmic adaptor subunit [Micropepsaceae bacterium]|nr:efflux RND transporter periplasmic adaptor subunit [Micropepsaceae bacterium]